MMPNPVERRLGSTPRMIMVMNPQFEDRHLGKPFLILFRVSRFAFPISTFCLRRDLFHQVIRNIFRGVNVLDVVVVFESFNQRKDRPRGFLVSNGHGSNG